MADEMSKNRASRVQSKQKEIRDANLSKFFIKMIRNAGKADEHETNNINKENAVINTKK